MPMDFFIAALVTLLVVVDPVGLAPTFLAITHGLPAKGAQPDRNSGVPDCGCDPDRHRTCRGLVAAPARDRRARLSGCRRAAAVCCLGNGAGVRIDPYATSARSKSRNGTYETA